MPREPVLKAGDAVFMSITKVLGARYMGAAHQIIAGFGLEPIAFSALEQRPPERTTNFNIEAERDLLRCKAMFAVLAQSQKGILPDDWALAQLSEAIKRGTSGHIYVVRGDFESMEHGNVLLPPNVEPRFFSGLDDFQEGLRADVAGLLGIVVS